MSTFRDTSAVSSCSWPFIQHPKWTNDAKFGNGSFHALHKNSAVSNVEVIAITFALGVGLKLILLHLAGSYSTRRRYYEPLASEVKAYSAEIGSTSRKTPLDEFVHAGQEIPDYAASIVLAMLDPMSNSYSFDDALHDYGRPAACSLLCSLITRGVYYTVAYHVFTYCARENFGCVSDFLQRRYNSIFLANVSTILIILMELCQLTLLFNRMSRELMDNMNGSFQLWLIGLLSVTFLMALWGTATLVKMALLLFGMGYIMFLWMMVHFRNEFNKNTDSNYNALGFRVYQIQREHSRSLPDTLFYECNAICLILAAPLLHTTFRLGQTEYMVFQSLARRFKRKRVFVRAFILTFSYQLCYDAVMGALFTLRVSQGCDTVLAGLHCHYSLLSHGLKNHTALRIFYLTVLFYRSCLIGSFKVIAMAYMATKSRLIRSFVEFCLVGQRWVAMNRWRRQNGQILFRDCGMIDLQSFVYKTFVLLILGAVFFYSLDFIIIDPSALYTQYANYLLLDLRFIFCFNTTIVGMAFRRLSKFGISLVITLSLLLYLYQLLWGDMLTEDLLKYKMMTPLYQSHTAWLRRRCPKAIRLRPVINVGKRSCDHEVIHLVDTDAFYPALTAVSAICAIVWNALSTGRLAVLKTSYYVIGDAMSLSVLRNFRGRFLGRVAHMVNWTKSSMRSISDRFKGSRHGKRNRTHIPVHQQQQEQQQQPQQEQRKLREVKKSRCERCCSCCSCCQKRRVTGGNLGGGGGGGGGTTVYSITEVASTSISQPPPLSSSPTAARADYSEIATAGSTLPPVTMASDMDVTLQDVTSEVGENTGVLSLTNQLSRMHRVAEENEVILIGLAEAGAKQRVIDASRQRNRDSQGSN